MTDDTSWQTYKDFVLKVGCVSESTYSVEAQGPTGEAKATFDLPFDERDLQIFLLQVGRPRRIATRGRVPEPMQQTVDFGSRLYNAVFSEGVRDIFVSAKHDAQQGEYGLRLKLRLTDVPELSDLPWEVLHDGHDFLALSTDTLLVRYLDLPRHPNPMRVKLPLRILVTISSPHGLPPLDLREEETKVREALAVMKAQGLVEIDFVTNVTLNAFQRTLRRAKRGGCSYHVWHYIGHGSLDPVTQSSVLMFCDEAGKSSPVGGFQLGALFNSYPETRLALLNACEGARVSIQDPFAGVAAALVERGVPAVIGMQFEISNETAVTFAEGFYAAIVDGFPVDAAITEARRAVFFMPNWVEWATPVLYMRSPNGELFDVREQEEAKPKATEREKALPAILLPRQSYEPEMVLIPAGEFLMGSEPFADKFAKGWEQPQHNLYLPDFYMAKTPVTNAQYAIFVQTMGYRQPSHWKGLFRKEKTPPKGKEDHPVVNVSWYDAMAYCRWLAGVTGKSYRLPSEAQWEKAARSTDGRLYPWGNEWDKSRLLIDEGIGISVWGFASSTTPVGQHSPDGDSLYGCADMVGNVCEWTGSLWGKAALDPEFKYPYDPADGRENLGAPRNVRRVVRGWFNPNESMGRCAFRLGLGPSWRRKGIGIRVCVVPQQD